MAVRHFLGTDTLVGLDLGGAALSFPAPKSICATTAAGVTIRVGAAKAAAYAPHGNIMIIRTRLMICGGTLMAAR